MGVILQVAYRRGVGISVPAPVDKDTPNVDWWYDHIAKLCKHLGNAGFTALLLPPVCKASGGCGIGCDGYGIFDDYDIGSKLQQGSVATRFGVAYMLRRLVAIAHANGIQIYFDQVPHQRSGGNNRHYAYAPNKQGRFPKNSGCFYAVDADGKLIPGCVPRDPIAGPISDDFAFGDELAPVNAIPKDYVMNGLVDAWDWLFETVGGDGSRNDDTKGQAIQTSKTLINSKSMKGKFNFGEYDDGNPVNVVNWLQRMNWECSALDFPLHYILESMCNNTARFDMRQLDHAGLAGVAPLNAVTFVENPDTDTDGFATIIWNKILAYAYILTSEGYPLVYYRDYAKDPAVYKTYGLQDRIDNLIWIHERLAAGETIYRHKEYQFVVYERLGNPGLLVGLNNDMSQQWKTVTVQTNFGSNVHLHDYSGHNGMDCWTDAYGRVTFGIPPNNNGLGYVCFSRAGLDSKFNPKPRTTSQVFYGAADLDIPPATQTQKTIGEVYCEKGSKVIIDEVSGVASDIFVVLTDAAGIKWSFYPAANRTAVGITATGFVTIEISAPNQSEPVDFALKVTYQAPQEFTGE